MDHGNKHVKKVHPRERANILSKITFFYTRGLFWRTYTGKKLEEDDLYDIVTTYRSQKLGDKLEKHVENDIKVHNSPSIYRILWSCYGKQYMFIGFIQLLMRIMIVTTIPMTLSKLVLYFDPEQEELTKGHAYLYAALLIGLNFVNIIYTNNYMLMITTLGIKIRTAFCSLMYRKCLKLTALSLSESKMAEVSALMTKDVTAFEMIILYGNDVWIGFVQAAIVCYLIYCKMGVAALIGVGFFFMVIPIQIYIGKKASRLRLESGKKTDERLRITKETLSAIKIVKMYVWENFFIKKILGARKQEVNRIVQIFFTKIIILLIGALTSKIAFYFLIMTYVWLGHAISAELVYFVLTLFQRLRHALSVVIPLGITESAELHATVQRIGNLLNAEDIPEKPSELLATKPKITLKEVTVAINDIDVLINVTMTVESGLTIVTGPLGCGKTILLKTLLRDYVPKEGSVCINGRISYASQEPWIFPSTLKQNIIFGEKLDQSRYEQVLRVCALNYDINFFEGGDNLIIGDSGLNLSKGQKARINLARAVYKDSDIYLLDDCLTALDAHVKEYVFEHCILGFLKDKLCILVSCDTNYIKNGDNLVIMEHGTIKSIVKCTEVNQNEMEYVPSNEKQNSYASLEDNQASGNDVVNEETKLLDQPVNTKNHNIYHESKKSGKVGLEVYNKYILFGGGYFMLSLIVISFILTQFSKSYTEKMVSNWVDLEQNLSQFEVKNLTNSTEYEELNTTHSIILILFSAIIVATTILSIITAYVFFNFTRKASNNLHKAMVDDIINAVMDFFDSNLLGNIINRFLKDLSVIDEQFPFVVYEFFEIFCAICGIMILIATVNVVFLLPVVVVLLVLYCIRQFYMPTGRNLHRLDASTHSPILGYLKASLEGLTTIRAFNAQNILAEEFDRHLDHYTSANYTLKCYTRAYAFALDVLCSIFISIIIGYFLASDKDTSVGNVGLAITQSFMLSGLVQYGLRRWSELENKMTSVERVLEYTNKEKELKNVGLRPEGWPDKGGIKYENVSLSYHNRDEQILRDISFTIEPKEKIGIVGRTGAGKTSIISTLFRLYEFKGKITIDEIDIKQVSLDFLRKSIAIIPQDPVLFTGTVRVNIDPMENYRDVEIWSAIEKVKLHSSINSLEQKITEFGSNFSTGQKQLICLARAIVSKHKIIVLDEATANMDKETDDLIHEVIKENFSCCTILTIAHKLNSVLNCDKIMVMERGEIVEYGDPKTLLKDAKGSFYKMVETAGMAGTVMSNIR